MDIFSLIRSPGDSELKKYFSTRGSLSPGDKLKGEVIELKDDGKILINFGKFRALARINFPVIKGEILNLHVIEKDKELRLSLDKPQQPPTSGFAGNPSDIKIFSFDIFDSLRKNIKNIIPDKSRLNTGKLPQYIKTDLLKIESFFKPIQVENPLLNASELKTYIDNFGLLFEKKIETFLKENTGSPLKLSELDLHKLKPKDTIFKEDIKPSLIRIKEYFTGKTLQFNQSEQQYFSALLKSVDSLLSNITYQQNQIIKKHFNQIPHKNITYTGTIENKIQSEVFHSEINKNIKGLRIHLKNFMEKANIKVEKNVSEALLKFMEASKTLTDKESVNTNPIKDVILKKISPDLFILKDFFVNKKNQDLVLKFFNIKTFERVKDTLNRLDSNIASYQNKSTEAPSTPKKFHAFVYDLPLTKNFKRATLKIYYPEKRREKTKEDFKISLLLEMDRIGNIRTDFFFHKINNSLSLTFFVQDEAVKQYFEENINNVHQQIAPFFRALNLNVLISEEKIAQFDTEEYAQSNTEAYETVSRKVNITV